MVPHWPPERRDVTLHTILVHMMAETNRHAGHADIVRETIDSSVGLQARSTATSPRTTTTGRRTSPGRAGRAVGLGTYGRAMSDHYVVTDRKNRPASAVVAIVVAILTGGYMLPWAIAAVRGTANSWSVFWVNLLLGWTVVGWIVALVMAIREHRIVAIR